MRKLQLSSQYCPSLLGVSYDHTASFSYRIITPLRTLYEVYGARTSWSYIDDLTVLGAGTYDMVILSRVSFVNVDKVRRAIAQFHAVGTRIILDYDDNFLDIPDWNPAKLSVEAQDSIRDLLGLVDGVTVSSDTLKRYYAPYAKRIEVIPNYVETQAWPDTRKDNAKIRIGLLGSRSHVEDWKLVENPLRRIMERYGDQVILCVSDPVPEYLHDLPLEIQPWVSIDRYPMLLNQIDIGLCPLQDDVFNRCKTGIKALEYGMAGAAIVASPTQYREIVAGRGTIARNEEEWYAGIEKYIVSPVQRNLAGRLMNQYVRDRWSAQTKAPYIKQAYTTLFRKITHAQGITYAMT